MPILSPDAAAAWLDAVRPGLALYRGAARISARLVDARDTRGPTGYSGFVSSTGRHGVILAGYSNAVRPGPCTVNGVRREIETVEEGDFYAIAASVFDNQFDDFIDGRGSVRCPLSAERGDNGACHVSGP